MIEQCQTGRWALRAALIALVMFGASRDVQAGTVQLRTSAVVSARADGLRLGEIATLEGSDAAALSGVLVVEDLRLASKGSAWIEISVGSVRSAIARSGANMGRLAISGAKCLVRIEGAAAAEQASEAQASAPEPGAQIVEAEALPTIRGRVAGALAELFGVDRTEIRFLFEERDESLLVQTDWGRRVAVQPASGASSSRVMVDVRIYAGDRLVENRRIRVDVEIRRRVVTLLQTVQRGAELTADILSESDMWLSPGGAAPVSGIAAAMGTLARSRLDAGSVLRVSEIEPAIIIRRNELVTIHCLRAGFEVRTRARAKRDAGFGDVIEFTLEGSRRPFLARVNGPGRAVVDLDAGIPIASAPDQEQSQ